MRFESQFSRMNCHLGTCIFRDVFDGVEFWGFWRQRQEGHVFGHAQFSGHVPARLIKQEKRVCSRGYMMGDLIEMKLHRGGVAVGQDEPCTGAASRADGAEDIDRPGALIVGRHRPRALARPSPGALVLLADPGFVLEPDLYRGVRPDVLLERLYLGGKVFLNACKAFSFWAWWRGRADNLTNPISFKALRTVLSAILKLNSPCSQNTRSLIRQRTTP